MAALGSQAPLLRRGLARSLRDGAHFSPSSSSPSVLRSSLSYPTRTQPLAGIVAPSSCRHCSSSLLPPLRSSTAASLERGAARWTRGLRATHRRPGVETSLAFSTTISSRQSTITHTDRLRRMEEMQNEAYKKRNQSLMYYTAAVFIIGIGVTYAAVPFYRAFCSATGFGGTPITRGDVGEGRFDPSRLVPTSFFGKENDNDRIRVKFNSDTSDSLPWQFTPATKEIHVLPGETALAFFSAKNRGPKDIVGIATYNVAPDRIAPYFAKVECFCFEEQKLLAGEEVDLPVFFFIDKDMLDDPTVQDVREVVLSYTFFSARRNEKNGQLEPDTDLSQYTVGKDLPGIK